MGDQSTTPATFSTDLEKRESDLIIIREPKVGDPTGLNVFTWRIGLNFAIEGRTNPTEGDIVVIKTRKPFLPSDMFEFTTMAPGIDSSNPDFLLARIQVVPNPYVATNRFEALNAFATGRGERVIKFINLPPQCTLRIFSVNGRLIRQLELNEGSNLSAADLMNGTLTWDLQSEDALTVAYGVYLYHVETPELGEKTGTFAIIK